MKTIGIIPARMDSYRFPGKPLALINGRPMIQHVYERASYYVGWDHLVVATCDAEIRDFCREQGWTVLMTSPDCPRAMDRCYEAAKGLRADSEDIIVVVQGDEPMLTPDMIEAVIKPIGRVITMWRVCEATMLALPIMDEITYLSDDTVKVVHDVRCRVLYTSRRAIPSFPLGFKPGVAKRIGGIFGFRMRMLEAFSLAQETPLEIAESCDSNRLAELGMEQICCTIPYRNYIAVDRPEDIEREERAFR